MFTAPRTDGRGRENKDAGGGGAGTLGALELQETEKHWTLVEERRQVFDHLSIAGK